MRVSELKAEIQPRIDRLRKSLSDVEPEMNNPSVAPMYFEMQGALRALESVMDRINGDRLAIKTYC